MLRRVARSLASIALVLSFACGAEPGAMAPEIDVDETVRGLVDSVCERDIAALMRQVALEFRGGPDGREPNLGYAEVQEIAREFLLRDHPLSARLESLRIESPDPDGVTRAQARVWFDASDALTDTASALPASAVGYRFDLRFERHEGTWQLVGGSYARIGPEAGG